MGSPGIKIVTPGPALPASVPACPGIYPLTPLFPKLLWPHACLRLPKHSSASIALTSNLALEKPLNCSSRPSSPMHLPCFRATKASLPTSTSTSTPKILPYGFGLFSSHCSQTLFHQLPMPTFCTETHLPGSKLSPCLKSLLSPICPQMRQMIKISVIDPILSVLTETSAGTKSCPCPLR